MIKKKVNSKDVNHLKEGEEERTRGTERRREKEVYHYERLPRSKKRDHVFT